jgi:hypothetical protein
MTFDTVMTKYLQNSSCSIYQARFLWNAAIDECLLKIEDEKAREEVKKLFEKHPE